MEVDFLCGSGWYSAWRAAADALVVFDGYSDIERVRETPFLFGGVVRDHVW